MFKAYQEHPVFDAYSRFDTETGRLETITEQEFCAYLPSDYRGMEDKPIDKIKGKNGTAVFRGETSPTHTRFPRRVYFQITRNCNLNCPACFIKAGKGGHHVPTSAIMDMASFLGQNGLIEVRITGGEPTTHPDFLDILHKFQEENIYVSLATNGMMSRSILDALCEEKNLWVICSIDGNRETHNRYRPGTFDRIIRNLQYLKNKNPEIRIRLTTVLTRENKDQMFELGKICQSVDAESITIIPLRPQVREPEMLDQMITAKEFKTVIEDLISAKEKLGIRFSTTIETNYKEEAHGDPVFRKRSACAAGREGTNLDYDYEKNEFLLYGCSYSPAVDLQASPEIRKPFLAGSFSPDNIPAFLDIWRDDSAWAIFRKPGFRSKECASCHFLLKGQCAGSCPIQNIDYSAISVEEDVLEQLSRQLYQTGEWYCYTNLE